MNHPPIDLQMYDLTKCFDGLWLEECCNHLFEAGVSDDKLALIYEGNSVNEVAIQHNTIQYNRLFLEMNLLHRINYKMLNTITYRHNELENKENNIHN